MGKDEQMAFELLKKNRRVQRPIIEKFNGRWLKEIGDGVLASFSTISEAVYCAKEIQKTCQDEDDLNLRIGIHLGEVVFEGNDVFGDGVNIASRLEPLAPVGGILVSESVYNNLINKKNLKSVFVGEKQLKNVKEPVRVYQVQVEGLEPIVVPEVASTMPQSKDKSTTPRKIALAALGIVGIMLLSYFLYTNQVASRVISNSQSEFIDKSIVVLPFVDMSINKDQEYFSDGMMEEILNHLVKIEDLKVISRTTAMRFKGTSKSVKEIAEELGVATVLEGSVRKDGDQVRITVQLIQGDTDMHLWSESYDRQLASIFEVQSDVAQQIAHALKVVVNPEVRERIEAVPTQALDAYDYYLRGNKSYWASWSNLNIDKVYESIEYYQKAIEIDEAFSIGYTGLGRSYWWLAHYPMIDLNKSEIWNKSEEYLNRAISLDPYNGWAYGELAVVISNWLWDSTEARTNLNLALKLMPNDKNAYIHYTYHEFRLGNCEKVQWASEKLQNLDPSFGASDALSNHLLLQCQNNYSKIVALAEEVDFKKLNANMAMVLINAYLNENQFKKAQEVLEYLKRDVEDKSFYYLYKAVLSAKNGKREITGQMLDSLNVLSTKQVIPSTYYAAIYAALGEQDLMYDHLNDALNKREKEIHDINFYSQFNSYKEDLRFKEIVAKMWIPLDQDYGG